MHYSARIAQRQKGRPMFLKKLFLASASVLMLALAYHFGASTATAQAPNSSVVAACYDGYNSRLFAFTANGDVFSANSGDARWVRFASVFGGSPTTTSTQSWGSVKVQQR